MLIKALVELTGALNAFQSIVFPKGTIHYQFKPTWDTTALVVVLSNVDAGTNQVEQSFFSLNEEVVEAALGFTAHRRQVHRSAPWQDLRFARQGRRPVPDQCPAKCNISKV